DRHHHAGARERPQVQRPRERRRQRLRDLAGRRQPDRDRDQRLPGRDADAGAHLGRGEGALPMRSLMRVIRSLPLLLVLLAVASAAGAGRGVFLGWDPCYGDGGVQNKNFACDTNAGSETLVGGFETNTDYPNVSGNEVIINLVSAGSPLPAWWLMRSVGTCR